ncbi:hypothetical protein [Pontibacter mucosus]|nr:hypothetical protein [Pontibacter mucosus]
MRNHTLYFGYTSSLYFMLLKCIYTSGLYFPHPEPSYTFKSPFIL